MCIVSEFCKHSGANTAMFRDSQSIDICLYIAWLPFVKEKRIRSCQFCVWGVSQIVSVNIMLECNKMGRLVAKIQNI